MSQLDLALEADISARHISFLETGRAKPSRATLLHLADRLEIPLRERNALLFGAGLAPTYPDRPWDDPALGHLRSTIGQMLKALEPFPALLVDRHWHLLEVNRAVDLLIGDVDAGLLEPPINVLKLSLHPLGMAKRIHNLPQWGAHILSRLHHQAYATADSRVDALIAEFTELLPSEVAGIAPAAAEIAVPLQIITKAGVLTLISMTTVFGTPLDVTLSEVALEIFLPADEATALALRTAAVADAA